MDPPDLLLLMTHEGGPPPPLQQQTMNDLGEWLPTYPALRVEEGIIPPPAPPQ